MLFIFARFVSPVSSRNTRDCTARCAHQEKSNLTRYKSGIRKQRRDADTFLRNLKPMTDAAGGRRRRQTASFPSLLRLFSRVLFAARPTFPTFPDVSTLARDFRRARATGARGRAAIRGDRLRHTLGGKIAMTRALNSARVPPARE